MKTTTRPAVSENNGFTLVEIAVSVAILGIALVSLIGLHTRMMATYINEQNRVHAALALQYVSAILETEAEPPEIGDSSERFEDKLDELGFFGSDDSSQKEAFHFEGWEFQQSVEGIGLPTDRKELSEDAIRKISLRVSWGPSADEEYSLVYFVANPLQIPEQAAAALGGVQ